MKEKINRDNLVKKYMRKITMASSASLICCEYDDDGVMVEAQGEHYDIDEVKKEVNSAIEIIKEQEG